MNIEAFFAHGGSPLRAGRAIAASWDKGTGIIELTDQTPRFKSAPQSGPELHQRSAEASRVDPTAGSVTLTHLRARLRAVRWGSAQEDCGSRDETAGDRKEA